MKNGLTINNRLNGKQFFLKQALFCRYEIPEFQQKVNEIFQILKDDSYWKEINADKTFDVLQSELYAHVNKAIDTLPSAELQKLW